MHVVHVGHIVQKLAVRLVVRVDMRPRPRPILRRPRVSGASLGRNLGLKPARGSFSTRSAPMPATGRRGGSITGAKRRRRRRPTSPSSSVTTTSPSARSTRRSSHSHSRDGTQQSESGASSVIAGERMRAAAHTSRDLASLLYRELYPHFSPESARMCLNALAGSVERRTNGGEGIAGGRDGHPPTPNGANSNLGRTKPRCLACRARPLLARTARGKRLAALWP